MRTMLRPLLIALLALCVVLPGPAAAKKKKRKKNPGTLVVGACCKDDAQCKSRYCACASYCRRGVCAGWSTAERVCALGCPENCAGPAVSDDSKKDSKKKKKSTTATGKGGKAKKKGKQPRAKKRKK